MPTSPLLHKLCGNVKVAHVDASTNVMYIVFRTDAHNNFRGFKVVPEAKRTSEIDEEDVPGEWRLKEIYCIYASMVLTNVLLYLAIEIVSHGLI